MPQIEENDDDLLLLQLQAKKKKQQFKTGRGMAGDYLIETAKNVPQDISRIAGGIYGLAKSVPSLLGNALAPETYAGSASAISEGVMGEIAKYKDPLNKFQKEPVSTMLDVSGVLGTAGKLGKTGNIVSKTAEAIDPMTYVGKSVGGIGDAMAKEGKLATTLETSALRQGAPKGKTPESFFRPAQTAIKENLPPVWKSYEKNVKTLNELQTDRQTRLLNYSKRGSTVDLNDIKSDILREKIKHKNKANYKEMSAEFDDIISRLDNVDIRGGYDGDIPVDVADEFKASLFKKAQGTFDRTQSPTAESKFANNRVGFNIMDKIDRKHPDIKPIGKRQRDLIELNDAIYTRASGSDKEKLLGQLLIPSVATGVTGLLTGDPRLASEVLLGTMLMNNPYAKHYGAVAVDRLGVPIKATGEALKKTAPYVKKTPLSTLNILQNLQNNK